MMYGWFIIRQRSKNDWIALNRFGEVHFKAASEDDLKSQIDRVWKDSYQPNDLPPIDETLHTEKVIESLQKRAMQLD